MLREQAIERLYCVLRSALVDMNGAWQFERVEGPTLTPMQYVSSAYSEDDLFMLRARLGDQDATMRAETTASSYVYAQHLLKAGKRRLPLCVWQAGKSYRRELNDGARAATLRFNEFWQLEFQCVYAENTKADYAPSAIQAVQAEIGRIVGTETRTVPSDRLPAYSKSTTDIEAVWRGEFKEMASVSLRTDFPAAQVLEFAVGLDRLVMMQTENVTKGQ